MTVRNAESMGAYGSAWQHRGFSGSASVQGAVNSLGGRTALICGNAETVFTDVRLALEQIENPVIFAVNDAGMYLPKVDHWVSLHSDSLPVWRNVRWLQARHGEKIVLHGDGPRGFLDYAWEGLVPLFCLSGYFAASIAWIMGCDRIVLCGCPGDSTRRFFDAGPRPDGFGYGHGTRSSDTGVVEQVERVMARNPEFKQAIRSMSGWTADYFGALHDAVGCLR